MYCETTKHILAIDSDSEYTCKKCRCLFVEKNRLFYSQSHFSKSELMTCLKYQFGPFWMLEKYKLDAIKSIVRKMKLNQPTKDRIAWRIKEYPVYTWDDFSLSTLEFSNKYVEKIIKKH